MIRRVKYPRTPHLPWSPGGTSDDKRLHDLSAFQGRSVVVTEKLDGENTTCYADGYLHGRSIDGDHSSRSWAKRFWAERAHLLPEGWRLCAENLTAVHSIRYKQLSSYLFGLSIWTAENVCLSWNDTRDWLDLLGMPHPPLLYEGTFDINIIQSLHVPQRDDATREGYVVRIADAFAFDEFGQSVAKYVRRGHVQTNQHWMHGPWTYNELA